MYLMSRKKWNYALVIPSSMITRNPFLLQQSHKEMRNGRLGYRTIWIYRTRIIDLHSMHAVSLKQSFLDCPFKGQTCPIFCKSSFIDMERSLGESLEFEKTCWLNCESETAVIDLCLLFECLLGVDVVFFFLRSLKMFLTFFFGFTIFNFNKAWKMEVRNSYSRQCIV